MKKRSVKTLRKKVNELVAKALSKPACCSCGRELSRLPATLGSASQVYQCADCFYPGTGTTPKITTVGYQGLGRLLGWEPVPGDP